MKAVVNISHERQSKVHSSGRYDSPYTGDELVLESNVVVMQQQANGVSTATNWEVGQLDLVLA